MLFELSGEIVQITETEMLGDGSYCVRGAGQQLLGLIDFFASNIEDRRNSDLLLEESNEIIWMHVGDLGQILNRNILFDVGINISQNGGQFLHDRNVNKRDLIQIQIH